GRGWRAPREGRGRPAPRQEGGARGAGRERGGGAPEHRGMNALEEEEDDERDEDERLNDLLPEAVVRRADERRLVEDRLHLHPRRQVLQVLDDLLHRIDDVQGVPARDAEDVEVDGVLAVHAHRLGLWAPAVLDTSDIPDEYGLVVVDLDDGVSDRLHALGDGVRVDV